MSKKSDTKREQLADHVRDRDHSFREGYRHALRELRLHLLDRLHEVEPQDEDFFLEVARWAHLKIERSL